MLKKKKKKKKRKKKKRGGIIGSCPYVPVVQIHCLLIKGVPTRYTYVRKGLIVASL
jgi:hypothetical protein